MSAAILTVAWHMSGAGPERPAPEAQEWKR